MKKSEIVVGGKYLYNPQSKKNIYDAFTDWHIDGNIEVVVKTICDERNEGDLYVVSDDVTQIIHWSELKPLK